MAGAYQRSAAPTHARFAQVDASIRADDREIANQAGQRVQPHRVGRDPDVMSRLLSVPAPVRSPSSLWSRPASTNTTDCASCGNVFPCFKNWAGVETIFRCRIATGEAARRIAWAGPLRNTFRQD
jgi:hypothetical protein